MAESKRHMVTDAVINVRSKEAPLVLDGEPFPYHIADVPIQVTAIGQDVHLIQVSIQVDRSVTIIDHVAVLELGDG